MIALILSLILMPVVITFLLIKNVVKEQCDFEKEAKENWDNATPEERIGRENYLC